MFHLSQLLRRQRVCSSTRRAHCVSGQMIVMLFCTSMSSQSCGAQDDCLHPRSITGTRVLPPPPPTSGWLCLCSNYIPPLRRSMCQFCLLQASMSCSMISRQCRARLFQEDTPGLMAHNTCCLHYTAMQRHAYILIQRAACGDGSAQRGIEKICNGECYVCDGSGGNILEADCVTQVDGFLGRQLR